LASVLDPYCGPAPSAENLFAAWNLDFPLLAAGVCLVVTLYRLQPRRRFLQPGLLSILLVIAFVSPLCAFSTALFSARTIHHIVVGSLAAPLIAALMLTKAHVLTKVPAEAVFLLHTAIYWLWHLPFGYAFALSGPAQYWLMQGTFIAASVWLWCLFLSRSVSVVTAVGLALGTMLQMGLLGALLTFAPYPLFEAHLATTQAFGLTPLQDQQLSGVLMWTLGFTPYIAVALWCLRQRVMQAPFLQER
jgi:putative membrane protein